MRQLVSLAALLLLGGIHLAGAEAAAIDLKPAQTPAPAAAVQAKAVVVYITRTGKRYHRPTCRYAKIASTVGEAERLGLTPCQVCNP